MTAGETLATPTAIRDSFRRDFERFVHPQRPVRGLRRVLKIVSEPGLIAVFLMRVQLRLEDKHRSALARLVHLVNLRLTGAEIGHGCTVGAGLVAKHPLGLVIGGGTRIGNDVTLLHNVTFGERDPGNTSVPNPYPVVGNAVLIGNGAVVLGAVRIGDMAKVGANAVVLDDVPSGSTAVGVPARERATSRRAGTPARD